ncbi:Adipocyte plasma membrane-associated protein [Galemys pyrenaicus]|uniref:Adipocyte plasma membrane-associated protein n=1 Tax=Galemys pyrenaicus TaxID=202257 RepID=A0A8J6DY43_GALPY|nr:Adipocyte plasma membrane-associated protein [Galemys pyrenaicus]
MPRWVCTNGRTWVWTRVYKGGVMRMPVPTSSSESGSKSNGSSSGRTEDQQSSLEVRSLQFCLLVDPRSSGVLMTPPIYARVQHRCTHLRMPTLECSQHHSAQRRAGTYPTHASTTEFPGSDAAGPHVTSARTGQEAGRRRRGPVRAVCGAPGALTMSEADGLRQRRPLRPQVVTDDGPAAEAKDGSSFSGRVFRVTFLMLAVSLAIPLLGTVILVDSPIDPQPLSFKEPPLLVGVLQPNTKLRQAERLFENQLIGPESIANIGDVMFTGTADGRVIKLENGEVETVVRFGSGPCKTRDDEPSCGRPLGIRAGPNGTLFVVDAYKGLFEVNPWTREVKLLLSSEIPIEGRKMSLVNDLTVTQDGKKIYFTDSSSKWQRRDFLLLVMEGTDDGRDFCKARALVALPGSELTPGSVRELVVGFSRPTVDGLLEYDTETKEVKVLLDQLRFPNGVQLSPAEDFVLVAETTMARIRRFYVSGLMKGGADLFVENLPGFPDNIRPSSSGGYWLGMSVIRANPGFSMLDFLSERPFIKRMIFKLFSQETVMKFVPRYSLVLELSDSGAFRRSLHDPDGQVVTYVSEVHEHDGYLYLGSFRAPFLCRLSLQSV